jgi:hypothetical protein
MKKLLVLEVAAIVLLIGPALHAKQIRTIHPITPQICVGSSKCVCCDPDGHCYLCNPHAE